MKKKRIQTTARQRATLAQLRTLLAEMHYFIFPVARRYRHHSLDFVALKKDMPQELLLVRPVRKGSILLRPYCVPARYKEVREAVAVRVKYFASSVRWNNRQLPYSKARPEWWREYLPPESQRELAFLEHHIGQEEST